jgi:hypothetical protein
MDLKKDPDYKKFFPKTDRMHPVETIWEQLQTSDVVTLNRRLSKALSEIERTIKELERAKKVSKQLLESVITV